MDVDREITLEMGRGRELNERLAWRGLISPSS